MCDKYNTAPHKIDWDKPIEYRYSGDKWVPATVVHRNYRAHGRPHYVVVASGSESDTTLYFEHGLTPTSIRNVEPTLWINYYPRGGAVYLHTTEDDARSSASNQPRKLLKININAGTVEVVADFPRGGGRD